MFEVVRYAYREILCPLSEKAIARQCEELIRRKVLLFLIQNGTPLISHAHN
jgi:hypothetical protein